jgi:hypothetical protein
MLSPGVKPCAAFLVGVLLCASRTVCGQSTASIEGVVTDQNGAQIAGAEITASDPAIGITRRVMTNDSGRYQMAALPIGNYRLEAHAPGFQIPKC